MHRGALELGAFLLALTTCTRALAHGVPPDAYAVLSHDAQGARAVSISLGVALRRGPQSYQFVCPMAWHDQFAAPVAALPDGTVVVGAVSGLTLLGEDGSLRPHPDPAAIGRSSDVVRSASGVFSLRPTAEGSEVLAVDAQTVRSLWKDTKSLYSIAAVGDKLVLIRADGMMLEQVTISAANGAELERQTAVLDKPVDYVYARANAGLAYALVVFRNGTMRLGSLQMNEFTKLAEGDYSIAGPLSVGTDTLVATDGKLTQLAGGQPSPVADDHNIVCLSEHDGLPYACDTDGVARVNGPMLADPLFRFAWLTPPDLTRVPEGEERLICNMQWADLRADMLLLPPESAPTDPALGGVAGAPPSAAGGGAPVAGAGSQPPAAGLGAGGAGGLLASTAGGPALAPQQPAMQESSGCVTLPGARSPRTVHALLVFAFAWLGVRRRRRSARHDQTMGQ
jgi:hypothetical protein